MIKDDCMFLKHIFKLYQKQNRDDRIHIKGSENIFDTRMILSKDDVYYRFYYDQKDGFIISSSAGYRFQFGKRNMHLVSKIIKIFGAYKSSKRIMFELSRLAPITLGYQLPSNEDETYVLEHFNIQFKIGGYATLVKDLQHKNKFNMTVTVIRDCDYTQEIEVILESGSKRKSDKPTYSEKQVNIMIQLARFIAWSKI